ncbi:MAG: PAS domain-containing protein [Streptococcus sp.]
MFRKALGDNVEIALHDLTSKEQEIVAIANTITQEEKLGLNYQIYHYII